jgi:hypothetical protein
MRKSEPGAGSRLLRAGIAAAATAAVVVAGTATPALAVSVPLTLSATAGPTGTATKTTASSTTAWLTGLTAPVVNFSIPICPLVYNGTAVTTPTATTGNITGATINKVSNYKALITVPVGVVLVSGAVSTKWNVCAYNGSGLTSALIGTSAFTVATAIGLTSVTPSSGPSLGGNTIIVAGTALPTTAAGYTSVTLGGVPVTNLVATSAIAFSATVPPHAPGTATLSVTTAAGTRTNLTYTYANGITISPNTAPAATATAVNPVYIDVLGAGFLGYTFGTAATNARVWLVNRTAAGAYDPGVTGATVYVNGPVAECASPVVISDNELICTMNLATGLLDPTVGTAAAGTPAVPNGPYTMVVTSNGDMGASDLVPAPSVSDVSSGSTFTVANY